MKAVAVLTLAIGLSSIGVASVAAEDATIQVVHRRADPYGAPRPGRGEKHVPLKTSFYIEIHAENGERADDVLGDSVKIQLQAEGAEPVTLLAGDQEFASGVRGRFLRGHRSNRQRQAPLAVYIERDKPLKPSTTYTVIVEAKSRAGATLDGGKGQWKFTTEEAPKTHAVQYELSLKERDVEWHGGFFTGFCKPSFCTSAEMRLPTYDLMKEARKISPRAWRLQRDFWLTGMQHEPGILSGGLPNIVRERETRRIRAMEDTAEGTLLRVEDFFGHEQYGIESNRPLAGDYHPGDEVLIADHENDARAKVIKVDDAERTVLVSKIETPSGGWKIEYLGPLPTKEDPNRPGLFPPGGCYLRKFNPSGTPAYFWKRLDAEWDIAHRTYGHVLMPNFTDAPGDLSIDGRNWTTAKDYAQLHEAVREITSHIIERYGDAALEFPWSVMNEPDLQANFWRSDWSELQKFYDYVVDGVLRAFEDHGYDSDKVFIGGLELGGIFGTNLRIHDFLVHCSPNADSETAVKLNAAYADSRLDGKRSKRVERLCSAHDGRGSPCDFVSIHAYNGAKMMADKMIHTKTVALEIDPEYYADLWINSNESCPEWVVQPDPAYGDSYLGNGYFSTWCADVAHRQLSNAVEDPRFAFGESILTFWPWPSSNLRGSNDAVQQLSVDDNGDGTADRKVTLPTPIMHFLALLSLMEKDYWVLPEKMVGGHRVAGMGSKADDKIYLLLYTHNAADTQSRSEAAFGFDVKLSDLTPGRFKVESYRFDKDHNSFFHEGVALRDREPAATGKAAKQLAAARELLKSDDPQQQRAGVDQIADLGAAASPAMGDLVALAQQTEDGSLRRAILRAFRAMRGESAFSVEEVNRLSELSKLRVTHADSLEVGADGKATVNAEVSANGANFIILTPES